MGRLLFAASVVVSASIFGASTAGAQPAQAGYAVDNFQPSESGSDWFANESLDLRGAFRFAISATGQYGYRSVIGVYHSDGRVAASILRDEALLQLGTSFVFADRLRIGLSLPVTLYEFGHGAVVNGVDYLAPQNSQSVGDLRISADLRLLGV